MAIGNNHVDAHNARAAAFAKEQKAEQARFTKAADAYIADKGASESSIEATRRAAAANKVKYQPKVGNYRQPESY
jgi:hypothetical protein